MSCSCTASKKIIKLNVRDLVVIMRRRRVSVRWMTPVGERDWMDWSSVSRSELVDVVVIVMVRIINRSGRSDIFAIVGVRFWVWV